MSPNVHIEVDERTADLLQTRAAELGVTVSELVAERATLESDPIAVENDDIAELDRRWKKSEAGGRTVPHERVVRWLRTWGTPRFQPWQGQSLPAQSFPGHARLGRLNHATAFSSVPNTATTCAAMRARRYTIGFAGGKCSAASASRECSERHMKDDRHFRQRQIQTFANGLKGLVWESCSDPLQDQWRSGHRGP